MGDRRVDAPDGLPPRRFGRPREQRFAVALGLVALALLAAFFAVRAWFGTSPRAAPNAEARAWALASLESARRGEDAPPPPASARAYEAARPIRVVAFAYGRVALVSETSTNLARAVADASAAFRARADALPTTRDDGFAHVSLAVPLDSAPILVRFPVLDLFQLVPLRDGIAVRHRGKRAALSPDELLDQDLADRGFVAPLPEIYAGVPMPRIVDALAAELGVSPADLLTGGEFERVPTATLTRDAYPKRVPVTAANVSASLDAMADFLVRSEHQGRFDYVTDARTSHVRPGTGYSLPRHAGTAYFLAQAGRITGRTDALDASRRAVEWVIEAFGFPCGGPDRLCLVEGSRADVGTASLTLVAIAELARTSDDPALRTWAAALGRFLLGQQRADGEMMHVYDADRSAPIDVQYLYYSGEAALALLRAHEVTRDARFLAAARKLLVRLSTSAWSFPGSRYVYNEEHWTCIALGEGDERLDLPSLRAFCGRVYLWNDRLQYRRGEGPWNAEGGYGVTPFLYPRTPPAATRGEAFVATYEALSRRGEAPPGMRAHVVRALSQLLAHVYAPGPTRFFAEPARLRGGMPGSAIDLDVRNDITQHAGSALVRYLDLLAGERLRASRVR